MNEQAVKNKINGVNASKSPSFFQVQSIQKKSELSELMPSRNHQDKPCQLIKRQGDDQIEDLQTNDQNQQNLNLTYQSNVSDKLLNKKKNADQNLNQQQTSQLAQNQYDSAKIIPKTQSVDNSFKDSRGTYMRQTKNKTHKKTQTQQQGKNKVLHQILRFFEKGQSINIPKQIQNQKILNYRQHAHNATNFLNNLQNDVNRTNNLDKKYRQKKKLSSGVQQIPEQQSHLQKSPIKSTLKSTKIFLDTSRVNRSNNNDTSRSSNFNFISFIQSQNFLIMPISKNKTFQFYIKRQRVNGKWTSQNQYHLYEINNFKYLLSANQFLDKFNLFRKKQTQNQLLGQLRKSYSGKNYQCFYFPKIKFDQSKIFKQQIKSISNKKTIMKTSIGKLQLINIVYESNLFGISGPRKMQVYIPKVNTAIENQTPLQELHKKSEKIQKYHSKYPRYNKDISAYKLDFKNRQIKDSKKNFQILKNEIDSQKPDLLRQTKQIMDKFLRQVPCIRFGKIGTDLYHLQVQYPFNILQGFALALSSFGEKL